MEQAARTSSGAGEFRPLNEPIPLRVKVTKDGYPTEILLGGSFLEVVSVDDMWRIDDEWWREKPVSRMYFRVLFSNGRKMAVFHDLRENRWYRQNDERVR